VPPRLSRASRVMKRLIIRLPVPKSTYSAGEI
jgi:hypothetical protein